MESDNKKNGAGPVKGQENSKTVRVVFISLLLDLLAFTMILPLFPALLDYYQQVDNGKGLYSTILNKLHKIRIFFDAPEKISSVLYGGFLGSMYSFLQFLGSPIIGALSDVYGRRPMMILCLSGIAFSYLLWAYSNNFGFFILSRIIGGISKGNVNLSMAIISDVTTSSLRGKAMALVGIAFSIAFVAGPMIGVIFAKITFGSRGDRWYTTPAMFSFVLAITDLFYIILNLKESLPPKSRAKSLASGISGALTYINPVDLFQFNGVAGIRDSELRQLRGLGRSYFLYLFVYSGLEFTLTFLTHYSFGFTRMKQGWMFFAIGTIMGCLQGRWVRYIPAHKTKMITELGLWLVIPAFICIAMAKDLIWLCAGVILYAVSTAMVVTCMMTLVTRIGPDNQKGITTGIFRSLGALARACGPMVASFAFWSLGSKTTYLIGAAGLVVPPLILRYVE